CMPIIHLKFKPDPSRAGPCVLIDPRPMRQLPLVERRTRVTWCGFWVRQGGTSPLTALPARHKGRHSLSRPDGGVVTQRTANPCTPVRFRLGPPFHFSKSRDSVRRSRRDVPTRWIISFILAAACFEVFR